MAEAWLRPGSVDEELLDQLARLGPFGHGCPEPLFESLSLKVREARIVGEKHLRVKFEGERRTLTGIAFNAAGEGAASPPALGETVDILYRVKPNIWQGRRRADVHLEAWRLSAP